MTSDQTRQLTRVLYVAVGAMVVVYVLLLAGLWRGAPASGSGEADAVPELALTEAQVDLPGLDVYGDVADRPLFSEDRQPVPKEGAPEEVEEPEPEPDPPSPLNVAVTGIIHTPQSRIVLLRDNGTGLALSLQERMPLPGAQGSWLVKAIEPTRVVFEDSANQAETAIELELGRAPAAPPPRQARGTAAARQRAAAGQRGSGGRASAAADNQDAVAERAAEIRRRIEERRAQLRREANQDQKQ